MIDDIIDMIGISSAAADIADSAFDLSDIVDASLNNSEMVDLTDLSDLENISHMAGFSDVADFSDVSDLSDCSNIGDFSDALSEDYNVSFGSQKATLQAPGDGIKLEAIITKEPGTANQYCIKTWKGTVHNVPGGTSRVIINGIRYNLPKLTG